MHLWDMLRSLVAVSAEFSYFEWTFECRLRTKTNAGRRGACLRRAQIRNRTRAGKGDPPAGRVAVTAA